MISALWSLSMRADTRKPRPPFRPSQPDITIAQVTPVVSFVDPRRREVLQRDVDALKAELRMLTRAAQEYGNG